MKPELEDFLEDHMLKIDGYDDCIIGIAERIDMPNVIAYDADKIIKRLMADGMSFIEADEYFYFNIHGSYVGPGTPMYIRKCKRIKA